MSVHASKPIPIEAASSWGMLLLGLPGLVLSPLTFFVVWKAGELTLLSGLLMGVLHLAAILLPFIAASALCYELHDQFLHCQLFFYKRQIRFDELRSIGLPSSTIWPPVDGVAFSFDLIELEYERGGQRHRLRIGPKFVPAFVRQLKERCPQLTVSLPGVKV